MTAADLVKCPGCDLALPADDTWRQVAHMETEHPGIIATRLEAAGFCLQPDGSWFDRLADPNG